MANIQEYLPEVEAQGPVGGTSPNLELSGAVGRGIEQLSGAIGEGADLIHRRKAQEETANIYSAFANKRSQYLDQIQQQTQEGTLDSSKLKEQYETDIQGMADKIDTPEGRNFFERQQARLKGSILQTAARSQAQLAKSQAIGNWKNGVSTTSSAIMKDPLSFKDSYDAGIETVDELIKNGGLPAKMRDQALHEMGVEYSKAAIRGVADTDPAAAKNLIDSGEFDQHLNSDQKHQMLSEVHTYATAQETESRRAEKAIEDAQKLTSEKWGQDHLEKLQNNALSTKEVLAAVHKGDMKWETGERWLNMIKEGSKQDLKSDPRIKNALIQRIVDPNSPQPIDSTEDLMKYVGKGLSISDFTQMNSLMNKTPEQQAMHQGEKAMFDTMRKTIRFKNMMTNQYDLLGEKKLAGAMADYIQAKKDAKANGVNPSDLVNPTSPMYFGNKLDSYQTPLQEQLSHQHQDRTDKALGLRPTGDNPNPVPVKDARKPGESPTDYLKRMNK